MSENVANTSEELAEIEMSVYKKSATSAITFKIVYTKDDLDCMAVDDSTFKPEMCHQIFGESESIFGYRSVSIDLYYLHNSSECYVDVETSGVISNAKDYRPDDIMKSLNPWLPGNYKVDRDRFLELVQEEMHDHLFGTVVDEYKDLETTKTIKNVTCPVEYKVALCDINDEDFKDFHRRFETFIIWFIDGANYIDLDDEKWLIYYVYEEFAHPVTKILFRSPVGFCSCYKFYAYPANSRIRLSQFFILPSHQKKGIGSRLYQTVTKAIKEKPEFVDMTVEEPTAVFQQIRDLNDCLCIYNDIKKSNFEVKSIPQKELNEILKKNKISKRQCRRLRDILNCFNGKQIALTDVVKEDIKRRLQADQERSARGGKRKCNQARESIKADLVDKRELLEAEFKKYIEDITPSIKYLHTKKSLFS